MKIKIMKEIIKFCMSKGVKFSEEQVSFQAEMLLKRFNPEAISHALEELFFETAFFPDASLIARKINQFANISDDKSMATKIANEIISDLHSNSFSVGFICDKFGEEIYRAIGGREALNSYGMGEIDRGIFIAQIRDAIMPFMKNLNYEQLIEKNLAIEYQRQKFLDMTPEQRLEAYLADEQKEKDKQNKLRHDPN